MTITAFNEAIRKMPSWGATVLETPLPNAPGWNYTFVGDQYDLKTDIAHYLQTRGVNSGANTLEDVINFTVKLRDLESPEGQCCFPVLVAANQMGDRSTSGEYWLDVLVLPTEFSYSRLGAVGRPPVGSVPLGYDDINLPFGMAFVGRRYDEGSVIRSMSAYEANFPRRKVPHLLE
ncbi:hypothetical protein N7465_006255 [Penicillium sp. CMV-2018d]|nr:hypothetical protein N7465_006255 [Penicillium sp. CMV-2018d]